MACNIKRRLIYNREFYFLVFHYYIIFSIFKEIPVTNVGKRDGAEVVHWFISDPFSTITRPCKELKHFEKQLIKAGETHIFRFEIDPMRDLGFVNANGEHFLEAYQEIFRRTVYLFVLK